MGGGGRGRGSGRGKGEWGKGEGGGGRGRGRAFTSVDIYLIVKSILRGVNLNQFRWHPKYDHSYGTTVV